MTDTAISYHCIYCGGLHPHQIVCPRVTKIEYYESGKVKSMEFVQELQPPRLAPGSVATPSWWLPLRGEEE